MRAEISRVAPDLGGAQPHWRSDVPGTRLVRTTLGYGVADDSVPHSSAADGTPVLQTIADVDGTYQLETS